MKLRLNVHLREQYIHEEERASQRASGKVETENGEDIRRDGGRVSVTQSLWNGAH